MVQQPGMHDLPEGGAEDDALRDRRVAFDEIYAGSPPWDVGHPQPPFLHLAESGLLRGHVLDVGCGTGEHALLAAGIGLRSTGIDISPTALDLARAKGKQRGLDARFVVWDALELAALGETFDTVLDSGLFHVFDDDERARFVAGLCASVAHGGRYYMLCFNEHVPGDWGPRRVRQDEIRASFADGWRVESIEAATFDVTISRDGVSAWLSAIART